MVSPVPQSASKWEFLLALNLDCNYGPHKALYNQMKTEASRIYDTSLSRRQNLRPEHTSRPPPWSNAQFTETALQAAVAQIYAEACPATRPLYAFGAPGGDNWVIKWMLYHVCRYRDSRNKSGGTTTSVSTSGAQGGSSSPGSGSDNGKGKGKSKVKNGGSPPSTSGKSGRKVYDAARDTFRS